MHHAPQGPHLGLGPQPVGILLKAVTVVADHPEKDEGHHDAAEHARERGLVALQAQSLPGGHQEVVFDVLLVFWGIINVKERFPAPWR